VDRDARACPRCGRFFASVRCPGCGFSGEEKLFARGCPACGYSAFPRENPRLSDEKKIPAMPLPFWIYFVSIAALLAVFAVLFFILTK
jgi:hypothetical protein